MCSKCMVFLTGLSGSGKSTIASCLGAQLEGSVVLDGDVIRSSYGQAPHGAAGHEASMDRLIKLSLSYFSSKRYVISAFVAPRGDLRERVKLAMRTHGIGFIEVYVLADLKTCQLRDPKGLYRRYNAGEKLSLAGLNEKYGVPETPDLICQTEDHAVEENVLEILQKLKAVQE